MKRATKNMSLHDTCKKYGLRPYDVAEQIGKPYNTLKNWFERNPTLFNVVLAGVKARKDSKEICDIFKGGME